MLMLQAEGPEECDGFMAYCNVKGAMQPRLAGRFAAMLGSLINPGWNTQDLLKWRQMYEDWELAVARYETQSRKKVDDETRIAVVIQRGPDEVKKLILQNQRIINDSYPAMRGVVMDYILGGQDFSVGVKAKPKKSYSNMDVDMFYRYGKSHFGRYEKSDQAKGKGKGKGDQFGERYGGYMRSSEWSEDNGEGESFQGKGWAANRSSSQTNQQGKPRWMTLYFQGYRSIPECGKWGHRARDCWKNPRNMIRAESSEVSGPPPPVKQSP